MRNFAVVFLFLMFNSLFSQQTDTIGEYFLQPIEVQKDDNLWKLAERHYRDGRQYSKFWTVSKTNGLTSNPDSIYPGMVLYKLAKRTQLPGYHEEKFTAINALLDKQETHLDSLYSKMRGIEKSVGSLEKDLILSGIQRIWHVLISLILGVISSLIASRIYNRFWPQNQNKTKWLAIILTGLLTTLFFLSGFDVGWKNELLGNNSFLQKLVYSIIFIVSLFLVFLLVVAKKNKKNKRPYNPYVQTLVSEFYYFLISPKKSSHNYKYWIGLWKIFGENDLSNELRELQKIHRQSTIENIERKLKSIFNED